MVPEGNVNTIMVVTHWTRRIGTIAFLFRDIVSLTFLVADGCFCCRHSSPKMIT